MIKFKRSRVVLGLFALFALYLGVSFFQDRARVFKIYDTRPEYTISAQNPDLTIVEFVDYSCPLCKKMHPSLKEALQKDGRIRFIPRPIAFGKPGQEKLVLLTYAAANQGKFPQMFDYIMTEQPQLNDEIIDSIAAKLGLDAVRLKSDMDSNETKRALKENEEFFEAWRALSTPTFLMGQEALYRVQNEESLPTPEELIAMFDKVR